MSAYVEKMPKVHGKPQTWRARCEDCMGVLSEVKPRRRGSGYDWWRGTQKRTRREAQCDADWHDQNHHQPTGQES